MKLSFAQSCEGDFCEFTENYPEEEIRKAIVGRTSVMDQTLLFSKGRKKDENSIKAEVMTLSFFFYLLSLSLKMRYDEYLFTFLKLSMGRRIDGNSLVF